MLKIFRNKRAQATLEYAVLIAVIAGALITMKNYLKRGYQGKMRQNSDQLGQQFATKTVVESGSDTTSISAEKSVLGQSGSGSHSVTKQSSKETGADIGDEYWGK
ncbi:MAG: hypothetical protein PHY94_03905 [Candidatus Omnitrophica bacterium]|nr:hypothetical protein [Candidatus Omnitrophota bacterium]